MYDRRDDIIMTNSDDNEKGDDFGGMDLELKNYYYDEIKKNLDTIEASLNKLKDNLEDHEPIFGILEATKSIADLAMVYGYEGIESLANKMGVVLEKARKTELSQSLVSNLQETVGIIRKVFTLSDDRLERDVIRRTASRIIAIEEGREEEKASSTRPSQPREEFPREEPLFDIKEPDSLYFLMSEDESEIACGGKESEEAVISRSIESKLKSERQLQTDFDERKHEVGVGTKKEEAVKNRKSKKGTLMNKFLHLFGH